MRAATGNIYQLNYISGGDGLCAIQVKHSPPLGEPEGAFFYTYKDHLGSILALTDDAGTVIGEQSFDAWGRYRNPDTWEVYNSDPSEGGVFANNTIDMPVWFSRGYTGHEHLRHFDLINMNGRLYDPIPARMLSADNFVQAPGATQSYNRYAYVFNNPLKYTDPNGEFVVALIAAAVITAASYIYLAGKNGWEWNFNKWANGDMVTIGFQTNGAGNTQIYGGGSSGGVSLVGGYNNGSGGGGISTTGQATYNSFSAPGGTGSINWGRVERAYQYSNGVIDNTFSKIPELSFPLPEITPSQTCPDCLNPETIGQNFFGLSYPGPDNPRTFARKPDYTQIPTRPAGYPAIGHDRRYDNLEVKGAGGLFLDTRAIGADYTFVREQLTIAYNPYIDYSLSDRALSALFGYGLGAAAAPKTMYLILSSPRTWLIEIRYWNEIGNQGVNNTPAIHTH